MTKIPLLGRTGVVGYALVDEADAPRLRQFQWRRLSKRKPYAVRDGVVNGQSVLVYMHREILGLQFGDPREVDHVRRNVLDNRRSQLRVATRSQNAQNRWDRRNQSGTLGVTWNRAKQRWLAQFTHDKIRYFLGWFDDLATAAHAVRSKKHSLCEGQRR